MKNIHSVQDALAFMLEGIYYSEVQLKHELRGCCGKLSSSSLIVEIEQYAANAEYNILKLERIFNYLMREPILHKNGVVDQMLKNTHQVLASVKNNYLRNILTISCVQNINGFKISSYRSAYMLAVELELDTVADLIQQMLEGETARTVAISGVFITEFNNYRKATNV